MNAALNSRILIVSSGLIGMFFSLAKAEEPLSGDRFFVRVERLAGSRSVNPALSTVDASINPFLSPRAPAELLNRAPATLIQSGSGREHLTAIRSPVLTGGAGAGSFLFLQDGVPLRAPGFANVNGLFHASFPFAQQVLVQKGPGDVGYGSNALHGAIDVRTPEPGEADSSAQVSYGSFGRARAQLFADSGRLSTGISVLDDRGYRADSGALEIKTFAAAKIGGGVLRMSYHKLEQETAGFVIGDDAFEVDDLRRSNPNPEAYRDLDHAIVIYKRAFDAGDWRLEVTPFARWTDMAFLQHFLPGDPLENNDHRSVGVQSLAERPLWEGAILAGGVDLDWTSGSLREFQDNPTVFSLVQGLHYDYDVEAFEAAPFAKITQDFGERFMVEGGVRVTRTAYDYDNNARSDTFGRFKRPADREDDFTAVTWRGAATAFVTPSQTLRLSVARGARPPQTTELYRLQTNQETGNIEPETLDSVEIGWSAEFQRARLGLVAFAMRKENVLFRDADGFNVTDASTEHVGIEGEATVTLTDTLTLRAAGTWAEHSYAFDRVVGDGSETIENGDLVDTAPRTLANAQLTWRPAPPWQFEAAWSHVGRYAMNAANTVFYDGHDVLDLRASRELGNQLSVTVIARNVTDERYARRADFAFGNERFFPGEERAFEVVLAAKF